jgi:hypothetical protein
VNRPTSVKIGHLDYAIEWVGAEWAVGHNRKGEINYVEEVIRVVETLSPYSMADTFLHEIVHALTEHYDAASDDPISRENLSHWMGAGLVMVFRDNPEAFAWWSSLIR